MFVWPCVLPGIPPVGKTEGTGGDNNGEPLTALNLPCPVTDLVVVWGQVQLQGEPSMLSWLVSLSASEWVWSDGLISLKSFPASLFGYEPDLCSFVVVEVAGNFRHSGQRVWTLETEKSHKKWLEEYEELGRAGGEKIYLVCL